MPGKASWLVWTTVGFFVFTAPVAELYCGVVHSPFEWLDHRCHCNCRVLVLFVDRLPCCGGVCVAMLYGGWFLTPDGTYDSVWDSVKPLTGNYFINYFQYQEFVGCICMLNYWFSSYDDICPDNYIYSRFKLKDKCRSEKWEVYLYGDMTIKVDRDCVEVLPQGVPPPGIGGVGFGSSPNLAADHTPTMSCACLLSVAWV